MAGKITKVDERNSVNFLFCKYIYSYNLRCDDKGFESLETFALGAWKVLEKSLNPTLKKPYGLCDKHRPLCI